MNITNKVIVITGGNSGIGKTTALALAKKKAIVLIIGRNKQRLAHTLKLLHITSPQSNAYTCNIQNRKDVEHTIKNILTTYSKIDILINNAGYGIYKGFHESSHEELRDMMETNYFGTVNMTKAVLPSMIKNHSGAIFNIASVAGKAGYPGASGYCATKHAVVGMTEVLYYELKDKGIHVHLLCPGAVNTPFQRNPGYEHFDHKKRHSHIIPPETVTKKIITMLEKNQFEDIIPLNCKIKIWGKSIVPWLSRKVIYKITRGEKY
ncbi:MAG TPA: SDR family oxidoreductase [Candidatus Nanoarchaeia archaeon]|nr:SDR family oxidoreductase [Candidatus Nanoarchaeia archaeon]